MSYLKYTIGYKANKCSHFSSKNWHRGLEKFGKGDIICPPARPAEKEKEKQREEKIRKKING